MIIREDPLGTWKKHTAACRINTNRYPQQHSPQEPRKPLLEQVCRSCCAMTSTAVAATVTTYASILARATAASGNKSHSSSASSRSMLSGPTVLGQKLFTDGLHVIHSFLSNRDWFSMSRTCRYWYASGASTLNRRLVASLIKRSDEKHTTEQELASIFSSPLRRHITKLTCEGRHRLTRAQFNLVRANLPGLETFRVYVDEAAELQEVTAVTVAASSATPLIISPRLQRLELVFGDSLTIEQIDSLLVSLSSIAPQLSDLRCFRWRGEISGLGSLFLCPLLTRLLLTAETQERGQTPAFGASSRVDGACSREQLQQLSALAQLRHLGLPQLSAAYHEFIALSKEATMFSQLHSCDFHWAWAAFTLKPYPIVPNLTEMHWPNWERQEYYVGWEYLERPECQVRKFIGPSYDILCHGTYDSLLHVLYTSCTSLTSIRFPPNANFMRAPDQWQKLLTSLPQLTQLEVALMLPPLLPGVELVYSDGSSPPSFIEFVHRSIDAESLAAMRHILELEISFEYTPRYARARFLNLVKFTQCRELRLIKICPLDTKRLGEFRQLFDDADFMPNLERLLINGMNAKGSSVIFIWNINYATQSNFRQRKMTKSVAPTPHARLVGIELNPGPTSNPSSVSLHAQSLFTDGVHLILDFLTQSEWIHSAVACRSWYSATLSDPHRRFVLYDTLLGHLTRTRDVAGLTSAFLPRIIEIEMRTQIDLDEMTDLMLHLPAMRHARFILTDHHPKYHKKPVPDYPSVASLTSLHLCGECHSDISFVRIVQSLPPSLLSLRLVGFFREWLSQSLPRYLPTVCPVLNSLTLLIRADDVNHSMAEWYLTHVRTERRPHYLTLMQLIPRINHLTELTLTDGRYPLTQDLIEIMQQEQMILPHLKRFHLTSAEATPALLQSLRLTMPGLDYWPKSKV